MNDTGEKCYRLCRSPVSTTPAINCSLVSMTPPIKFSTGAVLMTEVCSFCKTISGRRSRKWSPILSLEQPWKGAKAPHIPWSEAPEAAKTTLNQNGIRPQGPLIKMCGVFSLQFQWHHCRQCPTSVAGDIADLSPSLQLSPILGSFPPPWGPCSCHRQ